MVKEPALIFWSPPSVLKFARDKWAGKACPAEALAKEETAQPYHHGALASARFYMGRARQSLDRPLFGSPMDPWLQVLITTRRFIPVDIAIYYVNNSHMHRTTILLPRDLHRAAEIEARSMGVSLSELIRRKLGSSSTNNPEHIPAFYSREPWVGSGPSDLSINHDRYLYDE